jgi:hypothetical protein
MENTDKRMTQQEKQRVDQVDSLNGFIKNQEEDIKLLNSRIDYKQAEILGLQKINWTNPIEIDNEANDSSNMRSELTVYKEISKNQKIEIDDLNSQLKKTLTKKQHLDRQIQQLQEYENSAREVTDLKLAKLTKEYEKIKLFEDSEKDMFFMMYEDIRSQAYEYKRTLYQQSKTIHRQTEDILVLTKDGNDSIRNISMLQKNLERHK